jgi:Kef-type K+ transport system membrane component KefB
MINETGAMLKKIAIYLIILSGFITLILFVIHQGNQIQRLNNSVPKNEVSSSIYSDKSKPVDLKADVDFFHQFVSNIKYPLSILLLQVIVILLIAKIFGLIFKKLGQQTVIGEIIAGIFLGPSLIGWLFPDLFSFLFPSNSLVSLQFLSQIGLAFFMFVIGMELDIKKIKDNTDDAIIISNASIIFPFFLGTILSYYIYDELAPTNIEFSSFALFIGIAMSITAFPVLARILKERKLSQTPLGVLAITCAAADDVTAWCLLATVIAIVKAGSIISSLFTICLALLYIIFMLKIFKPWLQKISEKRIIIHEVDTTIIAISFFILLVSAYFTEIIGIHALFGAFIAGVIMPDNLRFKKILTDKIEDVSTVLLLPIFFAFTGLRTQIGLLNSVHLWLYCGIIIIVAIFGKFGGSAFTAKIIGHTWKDSLSIGALMNTRGLMELIVLNIGFDLGILSSEIFAILVLMALSTTFMTGPILNIIDYFNRNK